MPETDQDHSTQTLFLQEWRIYRTVLDNNYFNHHEVGEHLRRILLDDVAPGFRFLDVACGDASATAAVLTGTSVGHYTGIDLSGPALDLARTALAALDCPVDLQQSDFVTALAEWTEPVDVVWIGLSLHHLQTAGKLGVLRSVKRLLSPGGRLLIYEDTSPVGEDRAGWLRRWDAMRSQWTAFADADWDSITAHVHAADFPETEASWHQLGAEAGFDGVQ